MVADKAKITFIYRRPKSIGSSDAFFIGKIEIQEK